MRRRRRLPQGLGPEAGAASDMARQQLGWYVRNCARSPARGMLERVMLERLDRLKGNLDGASEDFAFDDDASFDAAGLSRRRQEFRRILKDYAAMLLNDDSTELNALFARDEFGLDDIDTGILLLLLRYERNDDLEQFADEVLHRLHGPSGAVASLLGIDRREARRRLAADGALIESGLICLNQDGCSAGLAGQSGYLQLARPLRKVMYNPYDSRQEWSAALVGLPLTTPLDWEDFEHLGAAREMAAKVIAGAGKARASGVNLLVHGPVGTGKTEFAKALAAHDGISIWSVGETDDEGAEPTRAERLAALKLAQRLLAKRGGALILLDEAEDVLASEMAFLGPFAGRGRDRSKVYLNRLVEQNPVPIVWTCNDVAAIDPAVLRRMTLAIEVRTPSRPVRARIWRRVLDETGLKLGADAVERLAGRYLAPPAVAANAARAAVLSGGGEAAVEEAMGGVLQLLGIGPSIPDADASDFDPALVNCDENLARLTERLVRPGASRQWSLCLYGPPGAGKSQFARYLAAQLGMEVMQQRASDLLSMWVGESEKQIAAAFQTARARRAMLVIDEADSLLSDRRGAVRSWEVTQVNEMLTWMESHPLPFVCTTNLMDRIDQASLRRFTLKLRFAPLSPAQNTLAFERFFGIVATRRLADDLTPGDFATVRRKRDLLGVADPSALADWLDEEAEAKGTQVRRIGFAAAHG
jgi:transitional endoplasmic reticulum ATPase